jgi:hypothetical protein
MATLLTVLDGKGERQGTFTQHPTELAREALSAAADGQQADRPDWAELMRQFASTLPDRPGMMKPRA